MRWAIGGVAGILFVVLSFVATGINVMPPPHTADATSLAAWFAEHGDQYRVGHYVAGVAFLLFYLPFFAALCERLRSAEGPPEIASRVAWAAAILCPAAGTGSGMFITGLAMVGGPPSPEVTRFAMAANYYAYTVSGAFGGVAMLGAATVILRTGVFARWLGWAGGAVGVAAIVGCAAIIENDPSGPLATISSVAWLGFFVWIVAVAIAMIRTQNERGHSISGLRGARACARY